MENESYLEPTIFDTLTQSREIQMLKTAIPYMQQAQKKQFAVLIKYMELQKAVQVFSSDSSSLSACSLPEEEMNSVNMLNELRKYATPKELETIDMLTNVFSMMNLYTEVL